MANDDGDELPVALIWHECSASGVSNQCQELKQ